MWCPYLLLCAASLSAIKKKKCNAPLNKMHVYYLFVCQMLKICFELLVLLYLL